MDSYKIFELVMEKYPGKDPSEVLAIVDMFRNGLADIEKDRLVGKQVEVVEADYKEVKALEEKSQDPSDRMAELKAKYKGKWKVGPKKCIENETISCAICGESFKTLTKTHIATHDNMTTDEYKVLCGYDKNMPLMAKNSLEASRERMKKGGAIYEARQKTLAEKKAAKTEEAS